MSPGQFSEHQKHVFARGKGCKNIPREPISLGTLSCYRATETQSWVLHYFWMLQHCSMQHAVPCASSIMAKHASVLRALGLPCTTSLAYSTVEVLSCCTGLSSCHHEHVLKRSWTRPSTRCYLLLSVRPARHVTRLVPVLLQKQLLQYCSAMQGTVPFSTVMNSTPS